jgi:O-antigen/teichoic acid export membrane protein
VANGAPPDTASRPEATLHLERSVRVGVLWKFVGQAGVQLIRLLTVTILARLLLPADYGATAIAVALASFAPTLGDMGMGSALVQTERATPQVRSTAFWGSLAFGFGTTALFVVLAWPIGAFLDDPRIGTMVAVGALTFAIYSLASMSHAMFIREMKFRAIELRFMLALVVAGILSILAASTGLGAWALVLQQIVLMTTFAAALWWHAPWRPSFEFSRDVFRELSRFAVQIAGGRWARLIELVVLSLLIGKLVSVSDLGAWSFAMSTVVLPLAVIAIPIAEVLFSAFSRLRGERERIAALWLDSIGLLAAVIVPLLVGLVVVAPDLIPLVFGAQWHVSVPIVQILSIYVIIRSLQSWNSVVLDAAGRPHITLWTQVAALALTPVAVVIGAHWGIEAVALCFVVGQVLAVEIPSFMFVMAELGVRAGTVAARLAGVAAATLLMAAVCLLTRGGLEAGGVGTGGRAVLTVAVGMVVYPAALSFFAPDLRRRGMALIRAGLTRARVASTRRSYG